MDSCEMHYTANSRLLPTVFDEPRLRQGRMMILEPRGRQRRPKACDFKLLAAYVAAYVGTIIPKEDYQRFINPQGEQERKQTVQAACNLEWRTGEKRDFNNICVEGYNAMSGHVARVWPFTRHFDSAWPIKWALRSTWTNRKKAVARAEKSMEKQRKALDGLFVPSDDDTQLSSLRARRARASKLGQFLYCIGGCQRMLTLDHFPNGHVGSCKLCSRNTQATLPLLSLQEESSRAAEERTRQGGLLRSPQRRRNYPATTQRAHVFSESSSNHRRRNPHTALSGSVTTYSDAGQYPSDRSTYGMPKPRVRGVRGLTKPGSSLRDRGTDQMVGKLNKSQDNRRNATQSQDVRLIQEHEHDTTPLLSVGSRDEGLGDDNSGDDNSGDNNSGDEQVVVRYPVSAATNKCINDLCDAWGVLDISDVFPTEIWPKPRTGWSTGVLEIFQNMAEEYPNKESREGIAAKFHELVKQRRSKTNAKSQWSITDARTTQAWARRQYGSLLASNEATAADVSLSQRLRRPTVNAQHAATTSKGKQNASTKATMPRKPRKTVYDISSSSASSTSNDTGSVIDLNNM